MSNKDWIGDQRSIYTTLGASNHVEHDRETNDYYATEPKATELLMGLEKFSDNILEPACGSGHMSKVLEANGYNVTSTDLIDRGYGKDFGDFLLREEPFDGDIITNPPYKFAQEFIEKSLELVKDGSKVAMFLKIQFLEGQKRKKLFKKYPPKVIYVSSSRLLCAINGNFDSINGSGAVSYAWYIWEKGFTGDTIIKWFN